jgi:hypothetical protein
MFCAAHCSSRQPPRAAAARDPLRGARACEFFDGDRAVSGNWVVPSAWMHIDAGRLRQLFLAHPNVRLCLSGHAHQVDRVEYLGVRYSCDGTISGNRLQGTYLDCPPGYVMVDLFDDGSSETEFIAYDSG